MSDETPGNEIQAGMSLADRVRSIHHAFNRGDNRKADVIALGDKVAALEAENAALRVEAEQLRQELGGGDIYRRLRSLIAPMATNSPRRTPE